MQQLISILGTDTSTLEARRLLFKAGGDIERALNLHYNSTEASGEPEYVNCCTLQYLPQIPLAQS